MLRLVTVAATLALGCGRIGYEPVDGGPCGPRDDDTIARYRFESDPATGELIDETGRHPGAYVGPLPSRVDGPPGCGSAIELPADGSPYAAVADHADFQLDVGSVDFWARLPPGRTDAVGLVSRDATDAVEPGHFSVWADEEGTIAARLQSPSSVTRCSAITVPDGEWVHIAVNFGPPDLELFVDGVPTRRDGVWRWGDASSCEVEVVTAGIAGNRNPWVIGASTNASVEGEAEPTVNHYRGGAIDEVRISAVRRDFAR